MASTAKLVDHRLQIMYRLLNNLVVKQEHKANEDPNEPIYAQEFEAYMAALEQSDTLYDYQGKVNEVLLRYYKPDLTNDEIAEIQNDFRYFYSIFTFEEQLKLMTELRKDRLLAYVEGNKYYRMLMGVPPLGTDPDDFVYYKGVAVHTMSYGDILKLKRSGALDVLITENPDAEYLNYIDKRINLIEARRARQFEVLWSPKTDEANTYREMYNKERRVWMQTYHQTYLTESTDFNEAIELTTIKMRAIIYYFINIYTTPLGKTSFTREESEDLYKMYGLTFPQNMPDSYRNATTYVLNYLVMYKGTNYVLEYIAKKIFSGLNLYKYFVRRRRKPGIIERPGMKYDELYDVEFILKPFRAINPYDDIENQKEKTYLTEDEKMRRNFTNIEYEEPSYKQKEDKKMILTYDEVKKLDPRWSDSEALKKRVFEEPFSYIESKYLGIDNILDLNNVSIGLSVVHRYFLHHRDILKKFELTYQSTGYTTNFWDLWVFYNAMVTYSMGRYLLKDFKDERIDPRPGDVVDRVDKMLGFTTIKTHPTIRMYWLIVMAQYPHETKLEEFPEAANSDTDFLQLMINTDKAIGLARFVDSVLIKARNHVEVNMILAVYRHVRIMSKEPEAYNTISTVEGQSFVDYLEKYAPELYVFYEQLQDQGPDAMLLEIDNCTQFMINILQHLDENQDLPDLLDVLYNINMMYGGISKYLLYILKLFKAWRVEFISEGLLLNYNENYNYQVNVDQITYDVNITHHNRWNMSQYDWLEPAVGTDRELCEKQRNQDALYMVTRYGDIKIS
jgi:hypothetical protein